MERVYSNRFLRMEVQRLSRARESGTIDHDDGNAIVEACERLHYTERTYPGIIRHSKLARSARMAGSGLAPAFRVLPRGGIWRSHSEQVRGQAERRRL